MDWGNISSRWMQQVKKYRVFLIVILVGLLILTAPEKKAPQEAASVTVQEPQTLAQSLEAILSRVEGAGRVQVLLTQAKGEEILYQADEDRTSQDYHRDTVLITEENRAQTGLVRQRNPPTYLGALVVCQGADRGSVRLSMVEAVSRVTGLTSDKITVLKMK